MNTFEKITVTLIILNVIFFILMYMNSNKDGHKWIDN